MKEHSATVHAAPCQCLPSSSPESALQHSLPVSKGDHVYLQILGPNGKSLPSIAQTSTSNL